MATPSPRKGFASYRKPPTNFADTVAVQVSRRNRRELTISAASALLRNVKDAVAAALLLIAKAFPPFYRKILHPLCDSAGFLHIHTRVMMQEW